jgi:CelD/BcsL family acetyltransferase involved in cellulose biosynthesis
LKIEIIRDIEIVKKYEDKWLEILQVQANGITFIELDWIISWWDYFGEQYELFIIMLKEDVKILGFFPFMITKKGGYKELSFIGKPEASYMDFIIEDKYKEKAISYIMDFLLKVKGKYLFNLHGIFEDSLSYKVIVQYLQQRNIPFFIHELPFYYQEINGDFENYLNKHFSSKTRQTMRRKENRLNKLGEVKFEKSSPKNLEQAFRIHDKRWQRKVGNSKFSEGRSEQFFKDLHLNTEDSSFKSTIDVITLNSKVIAFIYGFTCRGRYTFYRIAHDDDFYLFSPGELVLREKIKQCTENDIKIFDFGAGYEPYKADWSDNWINVDTIFFYNNTLIPYLIFRKMKAIKEIKAILKKNNRVLNFKKYTLGRIKYKFSKDYRQQYLRKWQRKGIAYLVHIINPLYSQEECFILHNRLKKRGKRQNLKPPYYIENLTINDLELISNISGEWASSIVRRLSMEHKFFIVKKEDIIICHFWSGVNTINIEQVKQRRKIKKNEAMIYDIDLIKPDEVLEIWDDLIEELKIHFYNADFQDLYIVFNRKQKELSQRSKGKGFKMKEKISIKWRLGKCIKKTEEY